MRLHRLEMTAFGPFAEPTVVDFDDLGADGVFLLHGRTGAGKSTVLDAIAFALYGTVPGVRREAKRLQSDHAAPTVVPRVALEATIGGRRLRLVRSPEFRRPKRTGTGERTVPAKATLEWLDGRGVNLSRIADIGDEVRALLGMSADQFFQVVLLPQGEFARFLSADNEEREALLERLFATERFGAAERWLDDRRRASAAELAEHGGEIDRLVAQFGLTAQTARPDDVAGVASWAADRLDAARAASAEATEALTGRVAQLHRVTAELAEANRRSTAQQRAVRAGHDLAELESGAAERQRAAEELARARRAEPIAADIADAIAARDAADAAARERADAAAALAAIPGTGQVEDPDAAAHAWSAEVGALDALLDEARTGTALAAERERLAAERSRLRRRRDELTARADRLPTELAAAEAAVRDARAAAATLPDRVATVARQADAVQAGELLRARRGERSRAAELVADRRSAHADARTRMLDLRELRLAGMAAELAGRLRARRPCAVCGSAEHPAPAAPVLDVVSDADERDAVRAEEAAAAARDAAVEALGALDRTIEALVARGGDRDEADLARALADQQALLATAQAASDRLDESVAAACALAEEQAAVQEERRAAEAGLGALDERIDALAERLDDIGRRVDAARGTDVSLPQRRDRLQRSIRAATRLRAAVGTEAATAAAAADRADRAATRAGAAGFAGVDEVAAALRPAARCERIEAMLTAANEQRIRAEGVLADPEVIAAAGLPAVDPAEFAARAEDAGRAKDAAVVAADRAHNRVRQLEELIVPLGAALDALAPVQVRHTELAELAEVVAGRGANSRRMTLRSYVLAARLEEVAEAASARLRSMCGGRYEFVHSDEAGPRGRRGGLGLHVHDDYTGTVRPAKTLSGGETFLASLALALGLADTVAAESGGRVLDTIFIDEGFGSLDDEALDAVMGVLDELRAGGRVIGIVSHLDELRQRIPSRLHVIRGRQGSRLEPPGRRSPRRMQDSAAPIPLVG